MQFRYRARDASGKLREGTVEAGERALALVHLQQEGLFVIDLQQAGGLGRALRAEVQLGGPGRVKVGELSLFCSQFSSLMEAGVPILQSLTVLSMQMKGKRLGRILEAVSHSIEGGESFSQALRAHKADLPSAMLYITAVAEASGRLDRAYALLAKQFEQEEELLRKVKSALAYPAVVLVVAAAVVLFMLTFVLPTYAGMFSQMGAKLPLATRVLMAVSLTLKRFWYLIPVMVALVAWGIRQAMRQPGIRGAWQRFLLRVPTVGSLIYKQEMARLCRTLATMAQSGVPLLSGLQTIEGALDFLPMREAVGQIRDRVTEGSTFAQSLRQQEIFDPISTEMISLGETAGTLETMLFQVAHQSEKDVNTLLTRLTSMLEPVLTLVLGLVIVSIIVPMILPMFDILGQIK